ncbi:MAG: PKD domain-containing protein [Bacteroidetes bacterium]|nr:MAG: PKD domain-containing protein [Bacteroidota bacterium]
MKTLIILLLTVFYTVGSFCQETVPSTGMIDHQSRAVMERYKYPGLDFPDYPQLQLSAKSREIQLPPIHDNSNQPYLRPVFRQQGASCGQAASVAYNFCYEINRLRGLPSDTSINQYPSHFVWNFMNGTLPYYGEGVSYFHTFDVLYDAGTPTEDYFGPIFLDDRYYWMDGYEGYYQAMHNRVSGMNSIHAGTPEGLVILKHWLHNHLDGSMIGGVANYYAGMPYLPHALPEGTPEAGKLVQIEFEQLATHALTIVGYNDSIRYDVNNDGLYTNNLDITGDGTVDMQDWEIGGLKYVNSYGTDWGDSGFCYMLYRTLALKYGQGGIWNNSVHTLRPDTAYRPLLTIKARVKHNKRGRIRITAGISADTACYYPEKTLSFSVFNFQGLDYYMAGNTGPDGKSLEFGLDITPLLNFFKPASPSRIFLIVDENDPDGTGDGMMENFSVINYTDQKATEFECTDTPLSLLNNDRTLASVVVDINSEPIAILPDTPIVIDPGAGTDVQFSATGGHPPYLWKLKHMYSETVSQTTYNVPAGEIQTPTDPANGYATIPLPFSFPFFSRNYDTLYMHVNGYLMFEKQDMPYYYLLFDDFYLRQVRAIACYMNKDMALHQIADNYLTVSKSPDKISFSWKISGLDGHNQAAFTASVYPDGKIEFHYGPATCERGYYPVTGLGNGTRSETIYSEQSGKRTSDGQVTAFIPSGLPQGISLSEDGVLSIEPETNLFSDGLIIEVSDAERLTTEKRILVTTGPEIDIRPSDSLRIPGPGVTMPLLVEITNHGNLPSGSLNLNMVAASANSTVNGGPISGIVIQPGQSIVIRDVFSISVNDTVSSVQLARVHATLSSGTQTISRFREFSIGIPMVKVSPPVVADDDNFMADPGEEVDLVFTISNYGNVSAGNIRATLNSTDAFAAINGNPVREINELKAYSKKTISYRFKVNDAAPPGRLIAVHLTLGNPESVIFEGNFYLNLGKPTILLTDLDKNYNSAVHMAAALRALNISYDITQNIDSSLFGYDYNFLFLGHYSMNHMLTTREDSLCTGFLDQGKGFYLEGGSFFKFNLPTMLRTRMRTQGAYQAWLNRPDTLVGISGMPTEGIQFDYTGDWNRTENLLALEPALPWFRDKNSGLDFVVGLDSGYYKTIASSIEFGGISMFNSPGREELMKRYLDFLGYETSPLSVVFQPSANQICKGSGINFQPISSGLPVSYQWSFPGGTPSAWDGPAPYIRYDVPGTYSASITVSNGLEYNTFTLENVIIVDHCTDIEEIDSEQVAIFPNPAREFINISNRRGGIKEVLLIDLQGRILLRKDFGESNSTVIVSVENLTPGLYLVLVHGETWCGSSKLLIN